MTPFERFREITLSRSLLNITMNKKSATLLVLTILITLPIVAFGYFFIPPAPNQQVDILTLVSTIFSLITPIFITFAVIMFMWAGALFLIARGDPNQVKTAGHALIWAVVGVVVGALSYSVPLIIVNFFS